MELRGKIFSCGHNLCRSKMCSVVYTSELNRGKSNSTVNTQWALYILFKTFYLENHFEE